MRDLFLWMMIVAAVIGMIMFCDFDSGSMSAATSVPTMATPDNSQEAATCNAGGDLAEVEVACWFPGKRLIRGVCNARQQRVQDGRFLFIPGPRGAGFYRSGTASAIHSHGQNGGRFAGAVPQCVGGVCRW